MVKMPIPAGPIFDLVKSKYQGEGHDAKKKLIEETADICNKIVASYSFYIEMPENTKEEHLREFREDIKRYGKKSLEVMKFAEHSDAPNVTEEQLQMMDDVHSAVERDTDEKSTTEEILNESLEDLGFSSKNVDVDPKETLDGLLNKIDDELYVQYYSILNYIIDQCMSFYVEESTPKEKFKNLKMYHNIAIQRL